MKLNSYVKRITAAALCGLLAVSSAVPAYAGSTTPSISAGYNRGAFVSDSGQLYIYGTNKLGEYGNGNTDSGEKYDFTAGGASNIVSTAVGVFDSTAVLKADGTMLVCGSNEAGQLGLGETDSKEHTEFITLDTNVVKMEAGIDFFIYLKADGSLWGVGLQTDRRLMVSHGTSAYQCKPVKLWTGVRDFSTGARNTGFITTKDELYMFGRNSGGQLGVGNKDTVEKQPVKVMEDVRSVSVGKAHTLAVKNDNTLWSWGVNDYGQLLNGKTSYDKDYAPVYAPQKAADNVWKACAGESTSAYITTDGTLYMAGFNGDYAMGINTSDRTIAEVQKVAEHVKDVAVYYHTIYVTDDGDMYTAGTSLNGPGDYRTIFQKRSYSVADAYDFASKLKITENPGSPDSSDTDSGVDKPSNTTLSSVKSNAKKKLTVKWNKNTSGTGYQIQYSTNSSFKNTTTVTVSNKNKTSKTITGLKRGKKYYVRIRTFKNVNGKKVCSAWSSNMSAKVK